MRIAIVGCSVSSRAYIEAWESGRLFVVGMWSWVDVEIESKPQPILSRGVALLGATAPRR
jgi:hypothetical protein